MNLKRYVLLLGIIVTASILNLKGATIKVLCSDDVEIELDEDVAKLSRTIKDLLEDLPSENALIPLPNISSTSFKLLFFTYLAPLTLNQPTIERFKKTLKDDPSLKEKENEEEIAKGLSDNLNKKPLTLPQVIDLVKTINYLNFDDFQFLYAPLISSVDITIRKDLKELFALKAKPKLQGDLLELLELISSLPLFTRGYKRDLALFLLFLKVQRRINQDPKNELNRLLIPYNKTMLGEKEIAATCLAFSPDNRYLSVGFASGNIIIWKIHFKKNVSFEYYVHAKMRGECKTIAFDKNSQNLIISSFEQKKVINVENKMVVSDEASIQITTSEDVYAVTTTPEATVFEIRKRLFPHTVHARITSNNGILSGAFSPDKKYCVALVSGGRFSVFDIESGGTKSPLFTIENQIDITSLTVSSDNDYIIAAYGNGAIKIFKLLTGSEVATLRLGHSPLNQAAFSYNMDCLAGVFFSGNVFALDLRYTLHNFIDDYAPFVEKKEVEREKSKAEKELKKQAFEPTIETFIPGKGSQSEYLEMAHPKHVSSEQKVSRLRELYDRLKNWWNSNWLSKRMKGAQ